MPPAPQAVQEEPIGRRLRPTGAKKSKLRGKLEKHAKERNEQRGKEDSKSAQGGGSNNVNGGTQDGAPVDSRLFLPGIGGVPVLGSGGLGDTDHSHGDHTHDGPDHSHTIDGSTFYHFYPNIYDPTNLDLGPDAVGTTYLHTHHHGPVSSLATLLGGQTGAVPGVGAGTAAGAGTGAGAGAENLLGGAGLAVGGFLFKAILGALSSVFWVNLLGRKKRSLPDVPLQEPSRQYFHLDDVEKNLDSAYDAIARRDKKF